MYLSPKTNDDDANNVKVLLMLAVYIMKVIYIRNKIITRQLYPSGGHKTHKYYHGYHTTDTPLTSILKFSTCIKPSK